MKKWYYEENELGDCFVISPDGHSFHFGNMEGTSKCCFESADFVIRACNYHDEFLKVLEKMYSDPLTSTYFLHQIAPVLKKYKKEKRIWEK